MTMMTQVILLWKSPLDVGYNPELILGPLTTAEARSIATSLVCPYTIHTITTDVPEWATAQVVSQP